MTVASNIWQGARVTRWWHVRHAPVPNPSGRIYGQADLEADVSNAAAIAALASQLPRDAAWVVSPLVRTHQTAQAIFDAANGPLPVDVDEDLIEQSFGDWQGRPFGEVNGGPGGGHPFWIVPADRRAPNGESFEDLALRVGQALDRLTARHSGRDIVAVTHGGTIRAALGLALGLPTETALRFAVDNLSLTRIDHIEFGSSKPAWRVIGINLLLPLKRQDPVAQ